MGTYNIEVDELEEKLEEFLREFEGDVTGEAMIEAWNRLSKTYGWEDNLRVQK